MVDLFRTRCNTAVKRKSEGEGEGKSECEGAGGKFCWWGLLQCDRYHTIGAGASDNEGAAVAVGNVCKQGRQLGG